MIHSLATKTLKAVLSLSSRTVNGHKLWILIYHRVLDVPDSLRPGEVDRQVFDLHMAVLAKYFNPISLDDAVDQLLNNGLPERAVTVTFDDGYADNLDIALPIMQRHGVPMTVFVSTGFIDGGRMWNDTIIESVRNWPNSQMDLSFLGLGKVDCQTDEDKRNIITTILSQIKHRPIVERQQLVDAIASQVSGLPEDLMLTTEGVVELYSSGVEIGAHTVNHPILAALDDEHARREIVEGKQVLEEMLNGKIRFFAYPNGRYKSDYTDTHVNMMHSLGFKAALSTHWGVSEHRIDKMQLPRFTPWSHDTVRFILHAVQNYRRTV